MAGRALIPMNFPERKARNLWILAAALAFFGHVAFAAFAIAVMREEPDDDLGAPGIEIAYELASTPLLPSDLPPGPESEASAVSPPLVEQKMKTKDIDLPKETPVEAEDPDRLVTIEKSETVKNPEVRTRMVKASEQSAAQEATAAPTIQNAPDAARSTTRDQGTGHSEQRALVTWQKELLAHLDKYKRYPSDRSQTNAEILITLNLDRTGRVLGANVARSSGDEAFDHAALTMVERASPVPAPPPLVADEGLSFSLPVIFRKHGH
jgi:periplasmic protein TonB